MWCVDLDMELWMDGSFLWLRQSLTEIDISAIYLFGFCFVLPFVLRFPSFGLIMMLWIFITEVSEILDIAYETQYLFLGLKALLALCMVWDCFASQELVEGTSLIGMWTCPGERYVAGWQGCMCRLEFGRDHILLLW